MRPRALARRTSSTARSGAAGALASSLGNRRLATGTGAKSRLSAASLLLLLLLLLAAACGKKDENQPLSVGGTPAATPASAAAGTEQAVAQATGQAQPAPAEPGTTVSAGPEGGLQHVPLTDDQFRNTPEHRDPFEPFQAPKTEAPPPVASDAVPLVQLPITEKILFPDRGLDEVQCRMILAMNGEKPRAYLLGPEGDHAYVTQGDFLGRPVSGDENQAEVYWRVYSVEEGGVSLELPASAAAEDTGNRHSLSLYTAEEMAKFDRLFSMR